MTCLFTLRLDWAYPVGQSTANCTCTVKRLNSKTVSLSLCCVTFVFVGCW